MKEKADLLGIHVDRCTLGLALAKTNQALNEKRCQIVFSCANPHSLVVAQTDAEFKRALNNSELVVADGVGIQFVSRIFGLTECPRITGADYFYAVMKALNERGKSRLFFFGSTEKVLELIVDKVKNDFPRVKVCGVLSPPFGPWSEDENNLFISEINRAKPDVLWVGMTAPKQEKWVDQNRHRLQVPVIGSIGAVFDFYAETVPRAPVWMCKLGIEWIHRFLKNPRKMWRRNLVSTPKFIGLVMRHYIIRESVIKS